MIINTVTNNIVRYVHLTTHSDVNVRSSVVYALVYDQLFCDNWF